MEVARQIAKRNKNIVWVMIESNLHEWNQKHTPGLDDPKKLQPGVSITDACVWWETNAAILKELNRAVDLRNSLR